METINSSVPEEERIVFETALEYQNRDESDIIYEEMIEKAKDMISVIDKRVHDGSHDNEHLLARYRKVLRGADERLIQQKTTLWCHENDDSFSINSPAAYKFTLDSIERGVGVAQFFYNEINKRCEQLDQRLSERAAKLQATNVSDMGAIILDGAVV